MATYYVDATTGDDGDSGLTEALAWQTVAKVSTEWAAGTFGAGDQILFKRGETWTITSGLHLTSDSGGAIGDHVVIGAYGSGARPIIRASGSTRVFRALIYRDTYDAGTLSYVTIQDLEVSHNYQAATVWIGNTHHVILHNLYVHSTMTTPGTWCGGIIIKEAEHVLIRDCTAYGIEGEGVYLGTAATADYVKYVFISNCTISMCDSSGIDMKEGTRYVFVVDSTIENCGIAGTYHDRSNVEMGGMYNVLYNCRVGGTRGDHREGIYLGRYGPTNGVDSGKYCTVERCLIYDETGARGGLNLYRTGNRVINCTFVNCTNAIYGVADADCEVKNCIFDSWVDYAVYLTTSQANYDFDYNDYSDGATGVWYEGGASRDFSYVQGTLGQEASGITTAANFAETTNYTLNSGSGCVNAGDSSETVYDWEDEYTPSGSVDIGWKEYNFTEPHRVFSTLFNSATFERFTGYSGVDYSTAVTPVAGSGVLRANITDQTDRYAYRSGLGNLKHFFVSLYVNKDSLTMASGDEFSVAELRTSGNADAAQVRIQYDGSNIRVRAGVINDSDSWTYTSYFNLGAGWNRIDVFWLQARDTSVNDGALVLWLDGTEEAIIEDLNNHDDSIDRLYVGAPDDLDAGTSGPLYVDVVRMDWLRLLGAYTSTGIVALDALTLAGSAESLTVDISGQPIFEVDHEEGDFSDYDLTVTDDGDLSVTVGAALAGTGYGLQCVIDDTTAIYGEVDFTQLTTAQYGFRFYIDLNSLTMGNYDTFICARLLDTGNYRCDVLIRYVTGTGYQVSARVLDDESASRQASWYNMSDAEHFIEILVEYASGADANDGTLTIWVDDSEQGGLTDVDLYDLSKPNRARLGAVSGLDAGTSGTFYLDELVLRDDGVHIGGFTPSVALDALTLAGSAQGLTVIPGATSVAVDALTLAGSAEGLTAGIIPPPTRSITVRHWRPVIATMNPRSGREYRLRDDRSRQWFIHYNADGSGFGYLTWRCKRKIGFDYQDLGHGFPVEMRKGPFRTLFSGQIVRIFERTGPNGDEIECWALGWVHVASADTYNWIYCDTRWSKWLSSETPSGSFRPDYFDWDVSNRLYFKPRRGVDFSANDYTYLRYAFVFGEIATRLTANYDVALPNSWPGRLEVRDSNGNVLWSRTTTGTGSIDVTTSGSPTYFEVRFYVTMAGENTADDDTVYGKLTEVKAYSVNVSILDAKTIADDLVELLSDAGHGLSDDTRKIASPGLALEPAAFDRDMTPAQVMAWCVQFGDADGNPLAWGVTMDDRRRLFLEAVDLTTVRYVVKPTRATLERGGDWGESAQKAYGVYTDSEGQVQRTSDQTRQGVIDDLGGYYRRAAVQVTGTTSSARVGDAVDLWLDENSRPGAAGSFVVRRGVWTPAGLFVPFDEIIPGELVQVQEWRAREATLTPSDYRDNRTTFPLQGVRVDEESRTVELIPRATSDAFARQMAIIQELVG